MKLLLAFVLALLGSLPAAAQAVEDAPGVVLRGVDKISGRVYDISLVTGQTADFEALRITLYACRFPVGNPAGDAFAALDIQDTSDGQSYFSGWMIASSPALSAMDHARYDIWVMRCTTS